MTNRRPTPRDTTERAPRAADDRALTREVFGEASPGRAARPRLEALALDVEHDHHGTTLWRRVGLQARPPNIWTEAIGGRVAPRNIRQVQAQHTTEQAYGTQAS